MKWFLNMKLAVKLLVSFVVVSLIAGIVGIIGITNIKKVDGSYRQAYVDETKPLEYIDEIGVNFLRLRISLIYLYYKDTDHETNKDNAINYDKVLKQYMEELKSSISGYEEEIFKTLTTDLDAYLSKKDELIRLVDSGDMQKATQVLVELQKIAPEVDKSVDSLFKANLDNASKQTEINAETTGQSVIIMIIMVAGGMLIAILLGLFISRVISKPVKQMADAARKIADGDLNVETNYQTKDEIGILAKAFGDMVENLNHVMSTINAASDQVASGSRQVSVSSMTLSQGATEQASSIEELTASLEEISAQTVKNAENANQASSLALTAKNNAAQGNEQMKQMLKAMDEINDASGNISKIIKVIDDIAFQTNILALNAAVEAARAGQHGKGFAVVAEEVRNLAARSANAAKETTSLIDGSIRKVEGGTRIANETAAALNSIVDNVARVAELVNDIAKASNEQAAGISQINTGVMQVSEVVQNNSATSEESAAASEELAGQAEMLKEQVSQFRLRQNGMGRKSYGELSPEMIKMLENMVSKERESRNETENGKKLLSASVYGEGNPAAGKPNANKKTISLDDRDFGKY